MVLSSILFWSLDLPSDRLMTKTGAEARLVSEANQGCFCSFESALESGSRPVSSPHSGHPELRASWHLLQGWQPCGEVSAHFKGSY